MPWLSYSGLPVGGVAVALMLGTSALLGVPVSAPLLVLAFCGTFLTYLAERTLAAAPEDRHNCPERRVWLRRHRAPVAVAAAAALAGASWALPRLRLITLGAAACVGVLSALYAWALLPGGRRLKAWPWAKPLAISGGWAAGGALLPVLEAGATLHTGAWALAAYRFLLILPNALWADWPDRTGDRRAGLCTVATEHGSVQLRRLSLAALALAGAGALALLLTGRAPGILTVDLTGAALMAVAVRRAPSTPPWFYAAVLDALVAWPLMTYGAARLVY